MAQFTRAQHRLNSSAIVSLLYKLCPDLLFNHIYFHQTRASFRIYCIV